MRRFFIGCYSRYSHKTVISLSRKKHPNHIGFGALTFFKEKI